MLKQPSRSEVILKAETFGETTVFDVNPSQVAIRFGSEKAYQGFVQWLSEASLSYTYSGKWLTANIFTFGIVPAVSLNPVPENKVVQAPTGALNPA